MVRRRVEARRRTEMAANILTAVGVMPVSAHEGGPFLWLNTDKSVSSETLADKAASRGVSVAPAGAFVTNGVYRDGIRIALSTCEDDEEVERGLTILRDVFFELRNTRSGRGWVL
jgi:DNA-binding transcriptional MocR family regulator